MDLQVEACSFGGWDVALQMTPRLESLGYGGDEAGQAGIRMVTRLERVGYGWARGESAIAGEDDDGA